MTMMSRFFVYRSFAALLLLSNCAIHGLFPTPLYAASAPLGNDESARKCRKAYRWWVFENKHSQIVNPIDEMDVVPQHVCPFYTRYGRFPSNLEQIRDRLVAEAVKANDKATSQDDKFRERLRQQYLARLAIVKKRNAVVNSSGNRFHYYDVMQASDGNHNIIEITINRSSLVKRRRYDGSYEVDATLMSTVNGKAAGSMRFRIFCRKGGHVALDSAGNYIFKPDRFWVSITAARWACSG